MMKRYKLFSEHGVKKLEEYNQLARASEDMETLQPEVRREPALALFGGPDGLDVYRALAAGAGELLKPEGRMVLEVGQGQAPQVRALLAAGFEHTDVYLDINGTERIVCAHRPRARA